MTPPKKDDLIVRLDARHSDLLKRIAELDRRTNAVLAQWTISGPDDNKAIAETDKADCGRIQ